MKSVLMAIQPKYCELIASGKKTVEVRKTAPKLETPFKCYIYCTQDKYNHLYDLRNVSNGDLVLSVVQHNKTSLVADGFLNGKIIGEFVCDRIDKYTSEYFDDETMAQIRKSYYADPDDRESEEEFEYITGNEVENPDDCELCEQSCLSYLDICKYMGTGFKTFYAWHISDLKIYDKPKELGEFRKYCNGCERCAWNKSERCINECANRVGIRQPLKCPPQSWCYVEECNA